jgi:hypothetical protein
VEISLFAKILTNVFRQIARAEDANQFPAHLLLLVRTKISANPVVLILRAEPIAPRATVLYVLYIQAVKPVMFALNRPAMIKVAIRCHAPLVKIRVSAMQAVPPD